jgi:hypothetical protein
MACTSKAAPDLCPSTAQAESAAGALWLQPESGSGLSWAVSIAKGCQGCQGVRFTRVGVRLWLSGTVCQVAHTRLCTRLCAWPWLGQMRRFRWPVRSPLSARWWRALRASRLHESPQVLCRHPVPRDRLHRFAQSGPVPSHGVGGFCLVCVYLDQPVIHSLCEGPRGAVAFPLLGSSRACRAHKKKVSPLSGRHLGRCPGYLNPGFQRWLSCGERGAGPSPAGRVRQTAAASGQ